MDGRRALLARPIEPGQRILDVARFDVGQGQLEGRHELSALLTSAEQREIPLLLVPDRRGQT
jgi:hypothetical protein